MKKLVFLILMLLFVISAAEASKKSVDKDLDAIIGYSGIEKHALAVSIKDLRSGRTVYQINDKILMHPASVQKILTVVPAAETLGEDYEFTTAIYTKDDTALIKLGADPYLTSSDLGKLTAELKPETKKVLIDDSIIERKNWGEGWQWDDDLNTFMPRFNSYNLDKNTVKITVMPSEQSGFAKVINPSKYPFLFYNYVVNGNKNDVSVSRDSTISPNTLVLKGTVSMPVTLYIPVNNIEQYFYLKLTNALENRKIYLKTSFETGKAGEGYKEIGKVTHPISTAIDDILKNSDNLVSETLSKIAGGKYAGETGTDLNAVNMFNDYCKKNKLDNSKLRIVDASGISKNNLVSADFVSEFLVKNKNNETLKHLPHAGEGTLVHRMLPIRDNISAKTGTLADISSIAGFLTTKKGNKYAFCIIVNDPSVSEGDMKLLEDYMIREVYLKL